MAAGIPVVATGKAAEGLPLTHGEDILFAHDKDEFVRCLVRLFENPRLIADVSERARVTIAKFSWKTIINDFERALCTSEFRPQPQDIGASLARQPIVDNVDA
jgi:glycosyltransferase involved in cell wall biosynthesis